MEKEMLEHLLIDYIDGKLGAEDRHRVEQELVNNKDAYQLYEQLKEVIQAMDRSSALEPSGALKASFEKMLQDEIKDEKKGKTVFFGPTLYKVAAAIALLITGIGAGLLISNYQEQQRQIAVMQKQMEETKLAMLAMIENQQSASQRIQGVTVAMTIENADDEVVKALITTLQEDANTNVRLAALEALSHFQNEPRVRKALISALSKQKDPVVQIALIQLMVKMKEKNVVKDLERIINDSGTINAVKDEAYSGILRLS